MVPEGGVGRGRGRVISTEIAEIGGGVVGQGWEIELGSREKDSQGVGQDRRIGPNHGILEMGSVNPVIGSRIIDLSQESDLEIGQRRDESLEKGKERGTNHEKGRGREGADRL